MAKSVRVEMSGRKFGRLLVLKDAGLGDDRRLRWLCRCDCGKEKITTGKNLRKGLTRSCGCLHKEVSAKANRTHGRSGTPTHRAWQAMKARCTYPSQQGYKYYGGMGVTICARWLGDEGYANFLADMGERPKGKTLDRKNPFGNYEPDNCKWATPQEQALNRRGQLAIALLKKLGIDVAAMITAACPVK